MTLIETIKLSLNKIKEKGVIPYVIIIHPNKAILLGSIKRIDKVKIIIPSLYSLSMIALLLGTTSNSKEFWNEENAYVLDKKAYNNIFRSSLLKTPNILDYTK